MLTVDSCVCWSTGQMGVLERTCGIITPIGANVQFHAADVLGNDSVGSQRAGLRSWLGCECRCPANDVGLSVLQ